MISAHDFKSFHAHNEGKPGFKNSATQQGGIILHFPTLPHSFPYLPYLANRSNLVQSIESAAARGAQRAGHEEGVEAVLNVLHHGFLEQSIKQRFSKISQSPPG